MIRDAFYIVVPAFNEGVRIRRVIRSIKESGYNNIIVIDDGSTDDTAQIAQQNGAVIRRHPLNLGPGASTQTGIEYALSKRAQYIITMDADGQHRSEDLDRLAQKLVEEDLDVVIGSRFIGQANRIPFWRKQFNKVGNFFTFLLSGLYVSDSQSGLKAMSRSFAERLNIEHNGFEFCTEIIQKINAFNADFAEIPVSVRYTRDTMSKGQNFYNGLKMLFNLFKKRNI